MPSNNGSLKVFTDFHDAFKAKDYVKLEKVLADDFVSIDENGKQASNKKDYLSFLEGWSKVFNTDWKVSDVVEKKDTVFSVEHDSDIFNNYFYDGGLEFHYTYIIKNKQLSSIQWDTLPGYANKQTVFNDRFTKFYQWVYINYPAKASYLTQQDEESAKETKALLLLYFQAINLKT